VARASLPSTPVLVSLLRWSVQYRHRKRSVSFTRCSLLSGRSSQLHPSWQRSGSYQQLCSTPVRGMTYTISVEVAIGVVGAREHGKADLGSVIIGVRSGLCAPKRTLDGGTTDSELIPVLSEWLEVDGFDLRKNQQDGHAILERGGTWYLDSVVDVGGCVSYAFIDDLLETRVARNDILNTDGVSRSCDVLFSVVVVEGSTSIDCDV
jgi:hypothetical protein